MLPSRDSGRTSESASRPSDRKRVFISYARDAEPDAGLAAQTYEALKDICDVFIDRLMPPGTNWARRIDEELLLADYFICFLSDSSLASEMIFGEIEKAHHLSVERKGRPLIVPVRVAFRQQYPYPLNAYLSLLNWVWWEKPEDGPRVIETLRDVVAGAQVGDGASSPPLAPELAGGPATRSGELPPPLPVAQLEQPGGTMDPESRFYIERTSDLIMRRSLRSASGVTLAIKGPRQVGKSSLLSRMRHEAEHADVKVVIIDFQMIQEATLRSAEQLLRYLCTEMASGLDLPDAVSEYWRLPLGETVRCTRYIERHVLAALDAPFLLAMDDVDKVFDADHRSDFFGMLRGWHNNRARSPQWKKLHMVLVTSAEPNQFITRAHQSPFNVAAVVEPEDFNEGQVAELVARHGLGPGDGGLAARLIRLLSGHPYLTRVALYEIAVGNYDLEGLLAAAVADRGPFGEHLRYYLFWLHDKPPLVKTMQQVLTGDRCDDNQAAYQLQGAGLVRVEDRSVVTPRCQLYATYFKKYL